MSQGRVGWQITDQDALEKCSICGKQIEWYPYFRVEQVWDDERVPSRYLTACSAVCGRLALRLRYAQ